MAFDPDAYLAEKEAVPKTGGFDPDAYLASKGTPVQTPIKMTDNSPWYQNIRENIARKSGAATRGIYGGLASTLDIPSAVASAGARGLNLIPGVNVPVPVPDPMQRSYRQLFDVAGVSQPSTPSERVIEAVTAGAAGAGGTANIAAQMARTVVSPVAKGVLGMMAAAPRGQVIAGATGAGAGQLAAEAGAGPGGQMAATLAGSLAPSIPIKAAANALRSGAEGLMSSSLKPTLKMLKSGDAAVAIDTMLDKGFNATSSGVEKMRARIDDINDQIKMKIAESPAKVETSKIARPVVEKLKEFRKQVNPNADVESIKKVWSEFKNHPLIVGDEMPVQLAQELKQGTYKQLNKKYGQMGSAETEGQKTIARGLKEQIARTVPEVAGLNAEETKLLKTLSVAERRALMDANKNPLGLSALAQSPTSWAAFMADKSALFKSLLARTMNASSKKLNEVAEKMPVQNVPATAINALRQNTQPVQNVPMPQLMQNTQ